jgi:hypothetical protein
VVVAMATWRLSTDCMVRVLSPDRGQEVYLFSKLPDRLCGTRLKRPGREFDHSFTSNAEVKNEWNCNCSALHTTENLTLF